MIRFLSTAALAFTLGYTGNSLSAAEIGVTDSQMLFAKQPRWMVQLIRKYHRRDNGDPVCPQVFVGPTTGLSLSPSRHSARALHRKWYSPERHGEPHQATAVGSLC